MPQAKPKSADVEIVFVGQAQMRGVGYFTGDRVTVDKETAAAYIKRGQAVPASEYKGAQKSQAKEQATDKKAETRGE